MIRVSTQYKFDLFNATLPWIEMFDDAVLRIYSGAMPASANNELQGVYLGYITRDGLSPAAGHGLSFDLSPSAYIQKHAAENWVLTGVATGIAGWARLSSVDDPPIFLPAQRRIDLEINPTDGNGYLLTDPSINSGLTRVIDFFQFQIPG